MHVLKLISRTQAKKVRCPYCGAKKNQNCFGKRGERLACHLELHQKAAKKFVDP